MKILFLDIDGPLATSECYLTTEFKFGKHIYKWNPICVSVLNEILIQTDCNIVLSSDWRLFFNLETLDEIFKWNNVIKSPIDITDTILTSRSDLEKNRINQIARYVSNNSINNYAVVDDLNLNSDIVKNFILVDDIKGISEDGVKEKLISYLNN